MRYTIDDAQILYDSLPFYENQIAAAPFAFSANKISKLYRRKLQFRFDPEIKLLFKKGDYGILVASPRHTYEVINVDVALKAWGRDVSNLLLCRMNVREICHEVSLEKVPLYINDETVSHIAVWRLRIAR